MGWLKEQFRKAGDAISNAFRPVGEAIRDGTQEFFDTLRDGFGGASSTSIGNGNTPTPVGNTYRGPFSSIFNQAGISREDWQRQVQANDIANDFSAEEAEKNRQWQEYMSNTSYQRAVADMRKAGLNPILALSNGGADVGSGATATAHGGVSSYNQTDIVADLMKLFAGLYISGANNATALTLGASRNSTALKVGAERNATWLQVAGMKKNSSHKYYKKR